jgi:hypothetical protein
MTKPKEILVLLYYHISHHGSQELVCAGMTVTSLGMYVSSPGPISNSKNTNRCMLLCHFNRNSNRGQIKSGVKSYCRIDRNCTVF